MLHYRAHEYPMSATQLSHYHGLQYHRNQLQAYSTFIVGAKLDKTVQKSIVSDSVHKLFNARKLLRSNVFQRGAKVYSEELHEYPNSCIEFMDSEMDIAVLLNELHDFTFQLETLKNATWKVVVVKQQWILVLCDHLLFDGSSGALILEDLVTLINGETITPEQDVDMFIYETLITPSYSFTTEKILKELSPKWSKPFVDWLYGPYSKFETKEAGWRFDGGKEKTFKTIKHLISINTEDFSKLKQLTSAHNVKFSSFWTYLNIVALSKIKQEGIEISIPCNLRAFLPDEFRKVYGLMVSQAAPKLVPETQFDSINWEYVSFIHSLLSKEALKANAQLLGMVKYIDPEKELKKRIRSPRNCTFELSNLGLRSFTKDNWEFKPTEFIFSQCNSLTGAQITHSAIASNERVNIMVEGVPESREFFQEYFELLIQHLKKILESL